MPTADPEWIASIDAALARVEALVVPSAFIRGEARRAFPSKLTVDIAPGIAPCTRAIAPIAAPASFGTRAHRHVVAIVGAIGPHKGSDRIGAIARELAAHDIALVVIGYTNEQLASGWIEDCFVHGPYRDDELPALLAAYAVDIVLFTNRLPESFSYTLSEAWAAGIPVIVPDTGALGERVALHGGGWRLPASFEASEATALIRRLFAPDGEAERARVKSQIDRLDGERIPTLESMSRALETLYERFAVPPQASDGKTPIEALAPLIAANLDGFAFRAELLHFAEELDNARMAIADLQAALASAQQWAQTVETNAQAWSAKLERDIDALKREVAARDDVMRGLPKPLRAWLMKRARRVRD